MTHTTPTIEWIPISQSGSFEGEKYDKETDSFVGTGKCLLLFTATAATQATLTGHILKLVFYFSPQSIRIASVL